jgi:hypothetical protein
MDVLADPLNPFFVLLIISFDSCLATLLRRYKITKQSYVAEGRSGTSRLGRSVLNNGKNDTPGRCLCRTFS